MKNIYFIKQLGIVLCLSSIILSGCGNAHTSTPYETAYCGEPATAEAGNATTYMAAPEKFTSDECISDECISDEIYLDTFGMDFNSAPAMPNTESYASITENDFITTKSQAFSTFSIDVDTASYSNVRRFITEGALPPADAVRTEEFINYFNYDYPQPEGDLPFSLTQEVMTCPWDTSHDLLLVGLQGKAMKSEEVPPSNLVFLLDVSGSMDEPNKLPLLKKSFSILTSNLKPSDTVSIVVYAGASGVVLDGAKGNDEATINHALSQLEAGGSTAGADGIELAYKLAEKYFKPDGNNRVILATDGDFNVGPSSDKELVQIIEEQREKGVYLTVLGLGMGNYKDSMLEGLADKGNGNYAYIDTLQEAKKVLGEELNSTLFTIAKDVKIQVEFNPTQVDSYRLIGYENRVLNKEDFDDDTVDAGEIGAGHRVTALYEIIPLKETSTINKEEACYEDTSISINDEYGLLKLRYKAPDADNSNLISTKFSPSLSSSTHNVAFASSVAEYCMLLRNSAYKGAASFDHVLSVLKDYKNEDDYKREFYDLVKAAKALSIND